MAKFLKRGEYTTFNEYVTAKTGKTVDKLNEYRSHYNVKNLQNLLDFILKAKEDNRHLYVYTDADADGINSTCQIADLLRLMHYKKVTMYVPDRAKDGYGCSVSFIDTMENGSVLLLIDNGITQIEAVKEAKKKNIDVLILDHHMNGEILPNANIIVDPEAIPDDTDFPYYCASGLMYKLNELYVDSIKMPADEKHCYLMREAAFSSIGTIGDMVRMQDDNRRIIQTGLTAMNNGMASYGVEALLQKSNDYKRYTAENISFELAPQVNAPGRMVADGAKRVVATFLGDKEKAAHNAEIIYSINITRKEKTKKMAEELFQMVVPDEPFYFLLLPSSDAQGLMGLAAAKVVEKTGKTAFIMSDNGNGILSGSARSNDEIHNRLPEILNTADDLLLTHGGHPGAAGFSLKKENFEKVKARIAEYPLAEAPKDYFYDLDANVNEISDVLRIMDQAEPFGKDFEKPVFRVRVNTDTADISYIGKEKDTMRIRFEDGLAAIGFTMNDIKKKYNKLENRESFYIYGTPTWNYFNGRKSVQFKIDNISN